MQCTKKRSKPNVSLSLKLAHVVFHVVSSSKFLSCDYICDSRKRLRHASTLLMVFSVMYIICEGPKLDVKRSKSHTSFNCEYNIIFQHK